MGSQIRVAQRTTSELSVLATTSTVEHKHAEWTLHTVLEFTRSRALYVNIHINTTIDSSGKFGCRFGWDWGWCWGWDSSWGTNSSIEHWVIPAALIGTAARTSEWLRKNITDVGGVGVTAVLWTVTIIVFQEALVIRTLVKNILTDRWLRTWEWCGSRRRHWCWRANVSIKHWILRAALIWTADWASSVSWEGQHITCGINRAAIVWTGSITKWKEARVEGTFVQDVLALRRLRTWWWTWWR